VSRATHTADGRRLDFTDDDGLFAVLSVDGEKVRCKLTALTKKAMTLAAPDVDVPWFDGLPVGATRLQFFDEEFRRLGPMEVRDVGVTDAGVTITLEAGDVESRASLWRALEDLSSPDAALLGLEQTLTEPPKIPARGIYTEEARIERLEFLSRTSGVDMAQARSTRLNPAKLTGNIENMIGSVEVPVGLAGPLYFRGDQARGMVWAPFATTEGALVASAARGARAITRSGGVTTRVVQQRMMRVPLFVMSNMSGALLLTNWVRDHLAEIAAQTRKVSRHARLVSVEPSMMGNMVHVSFLYETGDAAGQNMTTTCTWHACQWVMKQLEGFPDARVENFLIDANKSGDKKVNFSSFIAGRGTRVTAEALLDRVTIERVLKVSPEQLLKTAQGVLAGSVGIGMVGFNINVANVVAAMFTATGQDIASVHESSLAQLHLVAADDGIYASMLMPSLIVGTVGGGTGLPNQYEYLETLGCAGPGKVARFAEIIAGFALALDLSTLSAVASGQFATAHEKLGRNRPVKFFQRGELNEGFFEQHLRAATMDPALRVETAKPVKVRLGSSILTELTARKVDKLVGHFPMRLHIARGDGRSGNLDVLVKSKPLDDEVLLLMSSMASMCGARLHDAFEKAKGHIGVRGCHRREGRIYLQEDPRFVKHVPRVYGVHEDPEREAWILVLERLRNMIHMDSADDVTGWESSHIETVLRGVAEIHAIWYGREEILKTSDLVDDPMTAATMVELSELWEALGVHAGEEFPRWFGRDDLSKHRAAIRSLGAWWGELEGLPRTLIHNDFNPRNVCLRPVEGELRLCAYDWELAALNVPQHDVAEFLAFVLPPDVDEATVMHYLDVHRTALEQAAGVRIDDELSRLAYRRSLQDLVINRFGMYAMAHTFRHYPFMERCSATFRRLLELELGLGPHS